MHMSSWRQLGRSLRLATYACQNLPPHDTARHICEHFGATVLGLQGTRLDARWASFMGRDAAVMRNCVDYDMLHRA